MESNFLEQARIISKRELGSSMDDKIRAVLEGTPDKPPRSKLEPHEDVIRELRRKGRTYEDIAQFFAVHLNITVAPSTIYAFVRVRARRRQRVRTELPPVATKPAPSDLTIGATDGDVRRRIEELKRRAPPAELEKPVFHYDENEPLHLIPKAADESKTDLKLYGRNRQKAGKRD